MYLIDTNVWLELLLEQDEADDVRRLLIQANPATLHITEFTWYSIGIILLKLKKTEVLRRFITDTLLDGGVSLIRLSPADLSALLACAERFGLDFDDAYQYVAADTQGLTIVSFDADFDRTERGRLHPAAVQP